MIARGVRATMGAVVLAVAVAGCTGGDGALPTDEAGDPVEPLDPYAAVLWGAGRDTETMDRRVQELVAECMAEQGFDYIPWDGANGIGFTYADLDLDRGSREFAETYGYGVTTDPWGPLYEEAVAEAQADPNQALIEAMSDPERQSYYTALSGEQPTDDGEDVAYGFTEGGCYGLAQHQVYDADQPSDGPAVAALLEELETVWDAVSRDQRLLDATDAWAACMADAGYPGFTEVDQAMMSIYDEVNAVYAAADYSEATTEEDYARVQDEIDRQVAVLTEQEIATAVADHDCAEEAGYDDAGLRVRIEAEQDFVDRHRAELDALAATDGAATD